MKCLKALASISLLWLCAMTPSQQTVIFSSGFDSAAIAIFNSFTTPPTQARKILINNFVVSLKQTGIWQKLDVLYVLAAANSQAALINWKNPGTFTATAVNVPTFTADRGFTGDGATSRVNTTFVPSTNAVQLSQNNASIWAWSLTDNNNAGAMAGNQTAPRLQIVTRDGANNASGFVTDATASTVANASGIGLMGGTRATSATKKLWINGVQLGADIAVASTGIPAQSQWLCGSDPAGFSTKQIAMGAWGASLSGLELQFFNAALAYMRGVGASP